MSANPTAAPTGRKIIAQGKERSDAALGHASQNTTSPEGAKGSSEFSTGWKSAPLGDLCERITKGSSPNWQGFDYCESGIIFVRSQNVGWGDLKLDEVAHLPVAFNEKEKKSVLKADDVLLNLVGASIGRACVATSEVEGGNVNQAVAVIRVRPEVLTPKFLVHFLVSPPAQARIHSEKVDVARANFSLEDTRSLSIPLPSLPEQRRIVAEIEKQFTRLEAGVAALRRVQANLKRYRAAVLKAACEGQLVPTEAHKWTKTTIADSVQIIDYRGRTPPFSESGIPHLRSQNIRHGRIVWADLAFVRPESYDAFMTRGIPQEGDLLFTTEAPMGEVALAPKEKFSVAQRIMILRTAPEILNSRFLMIQLRSPEFQSRLRKSGTGSTVTGVSSRNFQPMTLLVPPLAEQTRIVAEVERRLSVVEELESVVTANLQRATRLRQSILQKAFTGELV